MSNIVSQLSQATELLKASPAVSKHFMKTLRSYHID
jgi:hypothetical protein